MTAESREHCANLYADTIAHQVSRSLFAVYGNLPIREENRIATEYRKKAVRKFYRRTEGDVR